MTKITKLSSLLQHFAGFVCLLLLAASGCGTADDTLTGASADTNLGFATQSQALVAQDWTPEVGAYYRIVFRHSGKCIRPIDASLGNTEAEQWEVDPSDETQLWRFEQVPEGYYVAVNKLSGKAFDIFDRDPNDVVGVWTQHNGLNQQLRFSAAGAQPGYYFIFDNRANQTLDVTGASTANGARIISYPQKSSGTANQEVQFVKEQDSPDNNATPVAGGVYSVKYVHSGKCLAVENASLSNAANVEQRTCNGNDEQKLKLIEENGVFGLEFQHSGQMLDIEGASLSNGANALQWPLKTSGNRDNQLFDLIDYGDGTYSFAYNHSGQCVDIAGVSTADGANVLQWPCKSYPNNQNQRFTFVAEQTTVVDARDGQSYATVTIGSQTWMAENLNYASANSRCPDDNPANCDVYGRIYSWAELMGLSSSYNSSTWGGSDANHQGVCPAGWRVPNRSDWQTLEVSVGGWLYGGRSLKKISPLWMQDPYLVEDNYPTDDYGFAALPDFNSAFGFYWSSTESSASSSWLMYLYDITNEIRYIASSKASEKALRCIQAN